VSASPRRGDLVVGPWGARFLGRRLPCAVGRGGIAVKRAEGDGITPAGVWRLEGGLRRPDRRPAARRGLLLRPIGLRDGWSDDPRDPDYNARVRLPSAHGAERLRRADPLHDLIAVTDFNRAPRAPGAGSAIFLHVWRGPRRRTEGCVAFRARDLAWILAHWRPGARVVIRAGARMRSVVRAGAEQG